MVTDSLYERCFALPGGRAALGVLAILLAAALGCDAGGPSAPWQGAHRAGRIGIALQIGSDAAIDEVIFRISHANGFLRSGTIPLYDETREYSAWFGLPAADGYLLQLTATSQSGELCEGSTRFDIRVGQMASAQVLMHCPEQRDAGTSQLLITGALNACPSLESVVASTARARVGDSIDLVANVSDPDAVPEPIQYAWTSSAGTLSDVQAAGTRITCLHEGNVRVSLKVSDGDPGCETWLEFDLLCVPAAGDDDPPRLVISDAAVDAAPPPPSIYDAGM